MGNEEDRKFIKIENIIAKGGFSTIYRIEKDNKYYALKKYDTIPKDEENEFHKIFHVISNLNNPNIIKYYYLYMDKNSYNIIMEYGGNTNLRQLIRKYRAKEELINEKIIYDIIIQICLGLKELHTNKIIHRDLKPDNILINKDNKIKIAGFSISKVLNSKEDYLRDMVGTFHYMAPEIMKGIEYNQKIDIYSLGCILYELLTLNEYYIDKIDEKETHINSDIYNPKWQELIDLLLQKDYNARPDIEECINRIQLIKNDIQQ